MLRICQNGVLSQQVVQLTRGCEAASGLRCDPSTQASHTHAWPSQCKSGAEGTSPVRDPAPEARTKPQETGRREQHQSALRLPLAGSLPLRRSILSGGSSECSPQPAGDTRSTASPARRESPPPAATPPPHCPAVAGALLHRRQGSKSSGAGASEKPGTQGSSAAL